MGKKAPPSIKQRIQSKWKQVKTSRAKAQKARTRANAKAAKVKARAQKLKIKAKAKKAKAKERAAQVKAKAAAKTAKAKAKAARLKQRNKVRAAKQKLNAAKKQRRIEKAEIKRRSIGSKIKYRDLGWLQIMRELDKMGQSYVAVGVFGGMHTSEDGGGPKSVAMIAAVNEYGSEKRNIPERSFLRSTLREREGELKTLRRKILEKVVDQKIDTLKGLSLMGLWAQSAVQAKIGSNIPPPNAPSTVRRKEKKVVLKFGKLGLGNDVRPVDHSFKGVKTLIDTGQLRTSITYEVGEGKRSAN